MKTEILKLRHADLIIDPAIQRKIVPTQLARMLGDNFNSEALGQLLVSRRDNGSKVILDGQHRWHVVGLIDPSMELTCQVFHGLTRQEEASLFLASNNQSAVASTAKFQAAVVAGMPIPTAVQKILDTYGLDIGNNSGEFTAVADAMRVASWPDGIALLDDAIRILTEAWSTMSPGSNQVLLTNERGNRPFRGQLVVGMCRVLHRYGDDVDGSRMVKSLISLGDRGPAIIAEHAAMVLATMGRMSADQAYAHGIVTTYNRGKGGAKLPMWELSLRDDEVGKRHNLQVLLTKDLEVDESE